MFPGGGGGKSRRQTNGGKLKQLEKIMTDVPCTLTSATTPYHTLLTCLDMSYDIHRDCSKCDLYNNILCIV